MLFNISGDLPSESQIEVKLASLNKKSHGDGEQRNTTCIVSYNYHWSVCVVVYMYFITVLAGSLTFFHRLVFTEQAAEVIELRY